MDAEIILKWLSGVSLILTAIAFSVSCWYVKHGRIPFLPIVGFIANTFSFVSGGIVLAALDLKWKDGMLASMLMCIMSTVICLIMTVWSWKMWRNDDEKPKKTRMQLNRALLIVYAIQCPMFIAMFFCEKQMLDSEQIK